MYLVKYLGVSFLSYAIGFFFKKLTLFFNLTPSVNKNIIKKTKHNVDLDTK